MRPSPRGLGESLEPASRSRPSTAAVGATSQLAEREARRVGASRVVTPAAAQNVGQAARQASGWWCRTTHPHHATSAMASPRRACSKSRRAAIAAVRPDDDVDRREVAVDEGQRGQRRVDFLVDRTMERAHRCRQDAGPLGVSSQRAPSSPSTHGVTQLVAPAASTMAGVGTGMPARPASAMALGRAERRRRAARVSIARAATRRPSARLDPGGSPPSRPTGRARASRTRRAQRGGEGFRDRRRAAFVDSHASRMPSSAAARSVVAGRPADAAICGSPPRRSRRRGSTATRAASASRVGAGRSRLTSAPLAVYNFFGQYRAGWRPRLRRRRLHDPACDPHLRRCATLDHVGDEFRRREGVDGPVIVTSSCIGRGERTQAHGT